MATLPQVAEALERIAPLRLAAEWDTVGWLVGRRRESIARVMTCLSITRAVVREAVAEGIDLLVSHHPLPFKPVARLTADTPTGDLLLEIAAAGIAVWSSHTAWDSAAGGINDQLAALLQLEDVAPLKPDRVDPTIGLGRIGRAGGPAGAPAPTVTALAQLLGARLGVPGAMVCGPAERPAGTVGIVCGSGADGLAAARAAGCDTFLTGEMRLHDALHADALGMRVILLGHHASEAFSMPVLADRLAAQLSGLECRAATADVDPLAPLDAGMSWG